jgi:hypothetical protein
VFSTNVVELPAVTVPLAEVAANVKVGTITVRLSVCVLLTPVPAPFIVTVETPPTALDPAVSVMVLVPVPGDATLAGANVAVTPAGSPLADNAMAELNPLIVAVETVSVTGLPAATVALLALGINVKLGATTVTATVSVRVNPPPLPLIVIVELPATALVVALMVAVTGAAAVSVEEEKCTVMPAAAPLAVRVTGAVNPPCAVSVIDAVPEPPATTETLAVPGVSAKFDVLTPQ